MVKLGHNTHNSLMACTGVKVNIRSMEVEKPGNFIEHRRSDGFGFLFFHLLPRLHNLVNVYLALIYLNKRCMHSSVSTNQLTGVFDVQVEHGILGSRRLIMPYLIHQVWSNGY